MKKLLLITLLLTLTACSSSGQEPVKTLDTPGEICRIQCIGEYEASDDKVSFEFNECFDKCFYLNQ